ncbi:hypothetical protein vseg_003749 [Gypsophila vaccaria]
MVTEEKKERGLGLRSMRQVNVAFMAKLGWRMLSEPNPLWARVLRHKYCKGRNDINMFIAKQNSSNLWKWIVEASDVLRAGVKASIGNVVKTSFWKQRWATPEPLHDLTPLKISPHIVDATVEEMWERISR